MATDKQDRIVAARMRLRERFEAKMTQTPAMADGAPLGSGPPNRHGMPQLPPGQHVTTGWPVLDLGRRPDVSPKTWRLQVDGEVAAPITLDFEALLALPQVDDTSDFHCVTTWSKLDVPWRGVRLADLAAHVEVQPTATHVLVHGYDDYTTNLPLEEALKPDVLLAHTVYGEPLPLEHGGPVRMVTPQLYAWKGAKWVSRLTFLPHDALGFWEEHGYSNTAHPWRNDRYS